MGYAEGYDCGLEDGANRRIWEWVLSRAKTSEGGSRGRLVNVDGFSAHQTAEASPIAEATFSLVLASLEGSSAADRTGLCMYWKLKCQMDIIACRLSDVMRARCRYG